MPEVEGARFVDVDGGYLYCETTGADHFPMLSCPVAFEAAVRRTLAR